MLLDPQMDQALKGLIDTDHDGLFDWDEVKVYLTNPQAVDSDGDGIKDGQENNLGLNPALPDNPAVQTVVWFLLLDDEPDSVDTEEEP